MVIRKRVKYLIVRNPLYVIGLNDIIFLKILQEKNRTPISYKITKPQVKNCVRTIETKRTTHDE
jgi:hypothetical protein